MAGYFTNPKCPIYIQRVNKSLPVEEDGLSGEPLNNGSFVRHYYRKDQWMSRLVFERSGKCKYNCSVSPDASSGTLDSRQPLCIST
jgi:hypothetical protein